MFDTHPELMIQRYKNGVRLVKPNSRAELSSPHSIGNVYQLTMPIFFMGIADTVVSGNDASADLVGAYSTQELPGKTLKDFYLHETEQLLSYNNKNIMTEQTYKILEEAGTRWDDAPFRYMAFKFPVFSEQLVIGLLGCCIKIDIESIATFSSAFLQLFSTGLLNSTETPVKYFHNTPFTQREQDILRLLIRGYTAKKIGEQLCLSPRTIEHYIANMKTKTNCHSKSEFIDKFIDEFI